jgi:hypothetical protein
MRSIDVLGTCRLPLLEFQVKFAISFQFDASIIVTRGRGEKLLEMAFLPFGVRDGPLCQQAQRTEVHDTVAVQTGGPTGIHAVEVHHTQYEMLNFVKSRLVFCV